MSESTMTNGGHCPLCGLQADELQQRVEALWVNCQRCGRYRINGTCQSLIGSLASAKQRAGLMAATREASRQGEEVALTEYNWENISARLSTLSIPQKLRRLMEYLGEQSQAKAGSVITVSDDLDYPIVAALDRHEYLWLRRVLINQKLVEQSGDGLTLTFEGWEAYRPGRDGAPGTCFVAMAFDPTLDAAYDNGIKPAIEDCRFTVVRVDKVPYNGDINDQIETEIRASQFLVADFTLHRAGVYFEAGFALGLGRQVIFTCRRDNIGDAHFDTRAYSHLLWASPEELRERLAYRIRATIVR